MRILVTLRNSPRAEQSQRLSRFNFGNRAGFDITTALLEKQLIKEITNISHVPLIHFVDDRMACYDRQLPAIGLLAEQSFGMHAKEASLLCDILHNFSHFVMTGHGLSTESYG